MFRVNANSFVAIIYCLIIFFFVTVNQCSVTIRFIRFRINSNSFSKISYRFVKFFFSMIEYFILSNDNNNFKKKFEIKRLFSFKQYIHVTPLCIQISILQLPLFLYDNNPAQIFFCFHHLFLLQRISMIFCLISIVFHILQPGSMILYSHLYL